MKPTHKTPMPTRPRVQTSESSIDLIQEQIRLRAYQLYEQRGSEHGRDLDDWLQAEAEISGAEEKRSKKAAAE